MRVLWLCWVLWALPLSGPGAAVTEEQILGSLLQQLRLREVPVLDESDAEELAAPARVRAQYVALLRRSHGGRSRGKRFSQNFREVAGRFLASEASRRLLVFSMERRLPPNSELVQAVLRLFQEPLPEAALRSHELLSPHSDRARVTVQWLQVGDDGSNRTFLIDSRLVSVRESGWRAFDVTEAVNFWQQLSRPREPLLLQVSVQREHVGPLTSSAHELVRFASQGLPGGRQGEPQLELHTLDLGEFGAQGNCDPEAPVTEGTRCCRQETYIDLQGMKWAEHWVLEPPGFLAYECVGACQQPPEALSVKWPFLGPRQCIASETTSLPMIVSVKEGGRPRPQVVSLPNMRVQKCGCASDGAPVPRKLEP
ncbi:left-right determination factor 1-like isoform X1 [Pteronotus mesoamericanus]|uniref:left-right determination factor 1-like isoform X1 n=1 Tax=Pteronotus mesoamericanus TaxID=1884717 RepID=UPI0023EDFF7B|nr:left-right determination factor 1-like isoform X1 [Pteronotus parnellii mesoamericanus]